MNASTTKVEFDRQGHVGEIIFFNPPHNFANVELLSAIGDAFEGMDEDPEIRCILLRSEGKSFCAGADLQTGESSAAGSDGVAAIAQFYEGAARLFRRKKPVVAAIQGAAIGAGLGLALSADFRIASPGARFSANFVRLGFFPGFGLTCTLPRLIGRQRATWMMMSAERLKPERAVELGLADRLSDGDDLVADARTMAAEIAANAPLSLLDVRATMTGSLATEVKEALAFELSRQAILRETDDYAEGVASVFARREARFVGR